MGVTMGKGSAEARSRVVNQTIGCVWEGRSLGSVTVEAWRESDGGCEISIAHSVGEEALVVLHWGVTHGPDGDWACPPAELWPQGAETRVAEGGKAAETPLRAGAMLRIVVPGEGDVFGVKFVLKCVLDGAERWFNGGAGDFHVPCKLVSNSARARHRILRDEAQAWFSLYNRFCTVNDLLDAAQGDEDVMAWLYAVLRLHHAKLLRWYGGYNYQSKDIAHLQDTLSRRMALVATWAENRTARRLARMCMAFISRGGGMAEQIRMQILDTMRRHGIREGHRPGIEDRFLEQWHQKLHQNTSADDIAICEAYLHFLHSGREGDFWQALWDVGRISRERLASMPNPITASPLHLPQLIPDMQRYLWTLKSVHAGADLHFMIESAKWALEKAGDHQAVAWLYDICNNFGAWWIPGKIAEARGHLVGPLRNVFAAERDVLLLDAALEAAFKTAVERIDLGALNADALIDLVDLVLAQVSLARDFDAEQESCLRQWRSQVKETREGRWTAAWALRALAAAHRVTVLLEDDARLMGELLQGKAQELGQAAHIPQVHLTNFSEEVVRSQPSFLLSLLLQRLEPHLRRVAGLGPWSLSSLGAGRGAASGSALFLRDMGQAPIALAQPTVLVIDRLSGTDDIPSGATAVLAAGTVDALSHVAIRARNQGVLLACASEDVLAAIKGQFRTGDGLELRAVMADLDGSLQVAKGHAPALHRAPARAAVELRRPRPWRAHVLAPAEFQEGTVGAKARHLAHLASALPKWLSVPNSLAVPFGTMERVLAENAAVAEAVDARTRAAGRAWKNGDGAGVATALAQARATLIADLARGDELSNALLGLLAAFGESPDMLDSLWQAIKHVWASKWSERAFASRARLGIADDHLCMGVLVQKVVPADYAFVLHTAHPLTLDQGTLLGQVVVGLGETLVGNHPGRPFSFMVRQGLSPDPRVLSYPSKRTALFVDAGHPGLMVRSDSNGEDLEHLAGAGLYESVACAPLRQEYVDYASCPLLTDKHFRDQLMESLHQAGVETENAMGHTAQDIEGVVGRDGRITIVQTRPQVAAAD